MTLTWDEVLEREDLIGGDIETQEDGIVFRGRLSEIRNENEGIAFVAEWVAELTSEGWKKLDNAPELFVSKEFSQPSDIGDGRISFTIPMIGLAVIFPKGGSKLDPSKVSGP